jgi:hypothetical protein
MRETRKDETMSPALSNQKKSVNNRTQEAPEHRDDPEKDVKVGRAGPRTRPTVMDQKNNTAGEFNEGQNRKCEHLGRVAPEGRPGARADKLGTIHC